MSKRKKKQRKSRPQVNPIPARSSNPVWRGGIRFALAAVLTVSVIGVALAAFKKGYDIEHDLSVVGQGVPTVVQVHDPGCQLCQRLRKNANTAMRGFDGKLLYRVADVTTPAGHAIQRRHQVPHVTLLLFDGDGELRNVLNGVRDSDSLRKAFELHVNRWGSAPQNSS